jgi:4,5-dihydroxyphthalate decarboxylase
VPVALPSGLDLSRVASGEAVTKLCADSAIEGLLYPELPPQVLEANGTIRRLFTDPKTAEQDYFRCTGIFPIMHLVAIRAELVEQFPWLPRTLCEVFDGAKRLAMQRLDNPRTVSLAWLRALQEEERALLGSDPWHYGLNEANRSTLEVFLRYAHEQGVTPRAVNVAELFSRSVTEAIPTYV